MISHRAQNIQPSATLSIAAKAGEMKKSGIDVISLSAGEPDYDTPRHTKDAAIKAINEGFTKYTPTSGIVPLKQAICAKFQKDNNLIYTNENILVSSGAKQSLYNIVQTLINPGDEVLMPLPYWVSYAEMVKLSQGECIFLQPDNNFKINSETIRKHSTTKTEILILNSPSNPTGAIYNKRELESIAEVCLEKNIFVISDEIYEKLIYDTEHYSIAQVSPEIKKQTAVVNGVSKTYAMTGWRLGYVAAEAAIIKAATKIQDHTTANPNSIAQKAAVAALTGDQECVIEMRTTYKKRRDYIVTRLNQIKGVQVQKPDGAFYVFPHVARTFNGTNITNSTEFCQHLLENAHVAAVPGSAFGDDSCIRLSYAASDENIKEGLNRLERFIGQIKS